MNRLRFVPGVGLTVIAAGCAPTVSVHAPSQPKEAADTSDCAQASELRNQAAQYRSAGRRLRARLFETRAHALCNALPEPVPEGESQGAYQRLEEVWSWLARSGPQLALAPKRLSDVKIAGTLDDATLGLSQSDAHRLTVEPVFAGFDAAQTTSTGWISTSNVGFAKVGEWFERFVVPHDDDSVRSKPIGPFADRIVVYTRKGYGDAETTVIFDIIEGKTIAELPLTMAGGVESSPLRLDDNHFALPVEQRGPDCSRNAEDDCAAVVESVEIWQAWPPKHLAPFVTPEANALNRGERVMTPQLPNQGKGPPKEKRPPDYPGYGSYAPTQLSAEQLRGHDESNERPHLRQLVDLGHGMLAADWTTRLSVIDWKSLSVLGVFPHFQTSTTADVASPSGRFVAYPASPETVGLFDRNTGRNRILMAPAFGWIGGGSVFSPDERWLATGGTYGFGYLWNTATGRLERTLPSPVPFVRIMEDEGIVEPEAFIRSGKEVVLSTAVGGRMERYEVPSGRPIPWPDPLAQCPDDVGPTTIAERRDGTAAFLGSRGRSYEVGPTDVTNVADCASGMASIETVSPDGEAFLERLTPQLGDGKPIFLMRWISTRTGKVLGQWGTNELVPHKISQDGRLIIGNAGPVMVLDDLRLLWPRRGIERFGAAPTVTNSTVNFDTGTVLDVARAELDLRSTPQKAAAPVSQERQQQLARIENQERVEAGEYVAESSRGEVTLFKGTERVATHKIHAGKIALREDGSELLLSAPDGLHQWQPATAVDRQLKIPELSGYVVAWVGFGPSNTFLLLAISVRPTYPDRERFVLMGVDETTEKVLFMKGLGVALKEPSFGTSGSRQVLRALLGEDLVAWDIKTGVELERWKQVTSYAPLANGTLLGFLGPRQIEIARVLPPERLITVRQLGSYPVAMVSSPDGRFELLGNHEEAAMHLRCRIGHTVLPFSACTESAEWEGLLKERLETIKPSPK